MFLYAGKTEWTVAEEGGNPKYKIEKPDRARIIIFRRFVFRGRIQWRRAVVSLFRTSHIMRGAPETPSRSGRAKSVCKFKDGSGRSRTGERDGWREGREIFTRPFKSSKRRFFKMNLYAPERHAYTIILLFICIHVYNFLRVFFFLITRATRYLLFIDTSEGRGLLPAVRVQTYLWR